MCWNWVWGRSKKRKEKEFLGSIVLKLEQRRLQSSQILTLQFSITAEYTGLCVPIDVRPRSPKKVWEGSYVVMGIKSCHSLRRLLWNHKVVRLNDQALAFLKQRRPKINWRGLLQNLKPTPLWGWKGTSSSRLSFWVGRRAHSNSHAFFSR